MSLHFLVVISFFTFADFFAGKKTRIVNPYSYRKRIASTALQMWCLWATNRNEYVNSVAVDTSVLFCLDKELREWLRNWALIFLVYGKSKICNFDKIYYCLDCHSDDEAIIPSRVIHNWDFRKYRGKQVNPRNWCVISGAIGVLAREVS